MNKSITPAILLLIIDITVKGPGEENKELDQSRPARIIHETSASNTNNFQYYSLSTP